MWTRSVAPWNQILYLLTATPRARRDAAVLLLPLAGEVLGQQEVRVGRRLLAAIDDERRADEALGRNAVDGVVRQVLARHPVNRRVEVCAGVLAAGKVVPVPGW